LVVNVGRLSDAKNHEMLFRVAVEVIKAKPEVLFVCAGHGEREQDLRELLQRLKVRDRVRLLGLRDDIPRLLAGADVFCFTSKHEGFPNALAEAKPWLLVSRWLRLSLQALRSWCATGELAPSFR
jgi:glycosyltransferase EpsF